MVSGSVIFWILVLGAVLGWLVGRIIGREGITLESNVIWGMTGALAGGIVAILLSLGEPLGLAFLGCLATLFLANVFHLHHVEDIMGDTDRGMRVKRKKKNNGFKA